jgi:hypothetical protein
MHYVVTGGAGFISSNTGDELVRRGHQVTVFDDLSMGKMENLAGVKGKSNFVHSSIYRPRGNFGRLPRCRLRAASGGADCLYLLPRCATAAPRWFMAMAISRGFCAAIANQPKPTFKYERGLAPKDVFALCL